MKGAPATSASKVSDMANDRFMVRAKEKLLDIDAEREKPQDFVPEGVYIQYVKNELDSESACLELPLTILLLLSFAGLAVFALSQDKVYSVEEAIVFDIQENANFAFAHAFGHKGIFDVNSIADFWSWLRIGLIPLVVQPTWAYSEGWPFGDPPHSETNYTLGMGQSPRWNFPGYAKPAPITNDYLRYHRLVGGIRLRQEVADVGYDLCRFPKLQDRQVLEAWWGKPCAPSDSGELVPLLHESENFVGLERTQWLFPQLDTVDELKATALDMEDGCNYATSTGSNPTTVCRCDWCREQVPVQPWLDEATRRIEVSFLVYNPTYGLYSYVGVNFFFNRGGAIHKLVHIMSVWADVNLHSLQDRATIYVSALLWVGALAYVFINESKEVVSVVRHSKKRWHRAILDEYMGPWNLIDWISIVIGVVVVSLYASMTACIADGNATFNDVIKMTNDAAEDPPGVNRAEYTKLTVSFFEVAEVMVLAEKSFRRSLCIYPIVVMIRLFKSFAAQPRLALVTATLYRAKIDIFHFFIVFFSVYMCMMVNSVLFFGQDIEDFSTFWRAMHTCFLAMFGDWDWETMREIGDLRGGIWFWLFAVIMVLILLNMLLAIVMDAYTAEKEKVADAISLPMQVQAQWRRWRQSYTGQRIRLNEVLSILTKAASDGESELLNSTAKVTASSLMEKVPKMQTKQATRQVESALAFKKAEESQDITEEDVLELIKDLGNQIQARQLVIYDDVHHVARTFKQFDEMEVKGDFEYDMLFGNVAATGAASKKTVADTVTQVSADLGSRLVDGLARLETWQDDFEQQQDELHGLIAEMQLMVTQQVKSVDLLVEMTRHLNGERHQGGPGRGYLQGPDVGAATGATNGWDNWEGNH